MVRWPPHKPLEISELRRAGQPRRYPLQVATWRLCPKKGVWNFQTLKGPAFIGAGEFQTPFFGQSPRACSGRLPGLATLDGGAQLSGGKNVCIGHAQQALALANADNKRSGPPGPCFAWAISGGQSRIQAVKGGQDLLLRRLFARGRVATLATYPGQTRTKSRTSGWPSRSGRDADGGLSNNRYKSARLLRFPGAACPRHRRAMLA